ncbi:Transcription initiation factor TFIID subunit 9 [Podila verticillata]|nr:Transcription initiation factor TFIID subunit 9 [Podila verticillata]KAF9388066.1 Transcription initiation factor TFIID subunit 9 [Podila verticillata]KAI9233155.1 MAG: transcription initiation factor IID, 31kD subunit-domain-containing protein [Podila humilis]
MTQTPQPRDAKVISLILQSLSVEDAEHKVIHQLLEFAHRYTTDVFQDALLYSEHAGRTEVGIEDVKLAIQGRVNHSFTSPPPKEFLLELAEEKNKVPLPLIPEKYGIRLPHERHCLTAVNFQLIPELPPQGAKVPEAIKSEAGPSGSVTATEAPSLFKVKEKDDDEVDEDEDMKDARQEPLTQNQQNLANHDAWKRKRADDEENYDD